MVDSLGFGYPAVIHYSYREKGFNVILRPYEEGGVESMAPVYSSAKISTAV